MDTNFNRFSAPFSWYNFTFYFPLFILNFQHVFRELVVKLPMNSF